MSFLSLLSYAGYFPAILEAVQSAVALVEAPGKSGAQKLAEAIPIVRNAIIRILPANQTANQIGAILALAEPLIRAAVDAFNQPGGLFNPGPPIQPPAPIPPVTPPVDPIESLKKHIDHMRERLKTVTDPAQMANIKRNLEAEEAKLAALQAK